MNSVSTIQSEKKPNIQSAKSLESLYSTSSSKQSTNLSMYKKKQPQRQTSAIPAVGEVRQRVISARLHRMRNLQNQLNDSQQHITELLNENRVLRTVHKRQDSALAKYESSNAELPQLLHSHSEEIRMWQTRCRHLQNQNKELSAKLKQKDAALLILNDQNKHLIQLNADRNLEEREKLSERVRYLEIRIIEKDEEMKVILRRTQLEAKTYKAQLNSEQARYKELHQKLEKFSLAEANFNQKSTISLMPPKLNGHFSAKYNKNSPPKLLKNASNLPSESSSCQSLTNSDVTFTKSKSPKLIKPTTENYLKFQTVNEEINTDEDDDDCSLVTSKFIENKPKILITAIRNGMNGLKQAVSPNERNESSTDTDENPNNNNDDEESSHSENSMITEKSTEQNNDKSDVESSSINRCISATASKTDLINKNAELNNFDLQTEKNDREIEMIRNEMRQEIMKSESHLDSICDLASKDIPYFEKGKSNLNLSGRQNGVTSNTSKRQDIDQKQKTKLLEALRAIDDF